MTIISEIIYPIYEGTSTAGKFIFDFQYGCRIQYTYSRALFNRPYGIIGKTVNVLNTHSIGDIASYRLML